MLGGTALASLSAAGLARWPAPPGVAETAVPEWTANDADFLRFSTAITGYDDLAPVTARRMQAAMAAAAPDFPGQIRQLAHLVRQDSDPQVLLQQAKEAGLHDTALAIVAAWYTGTVGSGPDGQVVAYEHALMYRPVADAETPPTYCRNGPAWWTAPPPAVGVEAPREPRAPSAPPTTGFPVPTADTARAARSTPAPRR